MDWKRERDGLAVVVGIVVVVGILAAGGSVARFATTLVATFLGVLFALQVDGRLGDAATGAATPVPAAGAGAGEPTDREETGDEPRQDVGAEPSTEDSDGGQELNPTGSDGAENDGADEGETADADDRS